VIEKKQWYRQGRALLDEIDNFRLSAGRAAVWFMGQHGFTLNVAGVVFYIDVILNDFTDKEGQSRRLFPAPFGPE